MVIKPKKYLHFYLYVGIFVPVALCLIAFNILYFNAPPKAQYCRTVGFPCKKDCGSLPFSAEAIAKSRNFKTFFLSEGKIKNKIVLEFARRALNKIKEKHDTVSGIEIRLSNSTPYSDYMHALDICDQKFPSAYATVDNHLYAMYVSIDTTNVPKDLLLKWRKKYGKL